jgi:hypothetical protein
MQCAWRDGDTVAIGRVNIRANKDMRDRRAVGAVAVSVLFALAIDAYVAAAAAGRSHPTTGMRQMPGS